MGQLGANRRLGSVSERAALLYVVALPYGDREGRLPGHPRDLMDETCPVLAGRWAWTDEMVEGLIDELVKSGLWSTWTTSGVRVIGIEKWRDHQHPSKLAEERPSEFPAPPSPDLSPGIQSNPIQLKAYSVPNGSERFRTETDIAEEEKRVTDCWIEGRPEEWKVAARGLSMKDRRELRNAAEQSLCVEWPDKAELTRRIRAKCDEYLALKWTITVDGVIRNLKRRPAERGHDQAGTAPPDSTIAARLRAEQEEIAAGEAVVDPVKVRALLAETKKKLRGPR